MEKKDLRKKIKITTALLVMILLIFASLGVLSILFAETTLQRVISASILGALTLIIIVVTIPVVNSYIKGITSSVSNITGVVSSLHKYGHIDEQSKEFQLLLKESESADQFGELATEFLGMMESIIKNIKTMEIIATGDLTKRAELVSNNDSLGIAINMIVDSMNIMMDDIRNTSDQLNTGITQFSSGAQSLAQSTAEQSATIEQLLISVKDITLKSGENAQRSLKATELSGDIRDNAQGGHEQMEKMTKAMDEINSASQSISTVMKAIDDIAFQTNILSLNAAVEAARAGQHGKGFAVVADEVRNLATKSATAASNSNEMINNTLKKSQMGLDIVKDTSSSLNTILTGVTDSASLIDEIAQSTEAQSNAIEAIHSGINQFSNVVYQNSATAEQSAAASDEMNIQTSRLSEMVNRFKIDEDYVSKQNKNKDNSINSGFEFKNKALFESSYTEPLAVKPIANEPTKNVNPFAGDTPTEDKIDYSKDFSSTFDSVKSVLEEAKEESPVVEAEPVSSRGMDFNNSQEAFKTSIESALADETFVDDESSKY